MCVWGHVGFKHYHVSGSIFAEEKWLPHHICAYLQRFYIHSYSREESTTKSPELILNETTRKNTEIHSSNLYPRKWHQKTRTQYHYQIEAIFSNKLYFLHCNHYCPVIIARDEQCSEKDRLKNEWIPFYYIFTTSEDGNRDWTFPQITHNFLLCWR